MKNTMWVRIYTMGYINYEKRLIKWDSTEHQVEADICYESLPTELKKTATDFYEFLDNNKKEIKSNQK